jgi:hypothetical protein
MAMRWQRLLRICLVVALPNVAHADRAFWGCGYGAPRTLQAGPITCRQEVQGCYKMTLSCTRAGEPLFTVADLADYAAVSEDGRYVLGLANRGGVSAFWVRDAAGKLLERRTHDLGPRAWPGVHYCAMSVSNVREWFDLKNPNVRFGIKDGNLVQIVVRGCDGRDVQLLR